MVDASSRFCITTWLQRCRTSRKPCFARMAQTSRPERTRSLPNLNLKSGHKYFGVPPAFNLTWICCLKEEFNGLLQIRARGLDCLALARDIKLGTESNVSVALALNDRR
jgi:hypothetical protein